AGAFDCFGKKRSVLIASFDRVMEMVARDREAKMRGQVSFFDVMPQIKTEFTYPEMDEYPPNFKYKMEREVAGIYLSGHPLSSYVDKLKHYKYNTSMLNPESDDCPDSETKITLGGMLVSTVNKMTKKGNAMGTAVLEDLYGSIELVAFGKSYERLRPLWVKDTVVSVTGTVRTGDNGVSIWVDEIKPFSAEDANKNKICCYFSLSDKQKLNELNEIIAAYPGGDYMYVKNTDDGMLYRMTDKFGIETMSLGELCALFGEENVKRN
ncbi:MAG: hypothetical protein K2M48_02355, partial [Clostridiales bacterium]|nr:hypothetical protein [Clostridiales bacterium]